MKPVKTKVVKEIGGPLKWWIQKQEMFPTLSKLAVKYLAVQATSAASERLFSEAALILLPSLTGLSSNHFSGRM
ncbi:unnamed protein product [Ectocarpus sp. 12 AP-2014]